MKTQLALSQSLGRIAQARPKLHTIKFAGGCDIETPPLLTPPGFCRAAQNFEVSLLGGYERIKGYERYDGHTSPSAATAAVLDVSLTGVISVGDTVTGVTSAATGVVIVVPDSTHIVLTRISGTFASGEVLNVSATPRATTTSIAHGATTSLLRAQYTNLAADNYRASIAAPTGIGGSLGGIKFEGVLYTWRNNVDDVHADLWKSSATGWQQVTLYNEVSFTAGGATQPAEGSTLTQGGVTATIKRVVPTTLEAAWATNTAAGRMIVTNPAGGNFAAGAATVGGINVTLSGAETAITFLKDGRFELLIENFAGGLSTNRIYGCDGVNRGFEFDGTVLVPISTGMTVDAPSHVYSHKNQLFLSFGPSVQHAAPGLPYVWSVVLGASEIGMGDTVNGFMTQPGSTASGALAIFTRNRTSMLYGTGVGDWELIPYRRELGAYAYTIQECLGTTFLDDKGVTTLSTAQEFGNFVHSSLSMKMHSWVNAKRAKAVASCISRDKNQYRIFFSDGYVLFVTFASDGVHGLMPCYFPNVATWVWSSEESDGSETIYFGATDGMVYQMEKGTSFDGTAIDYFIELSWDWLKSYQVIKRFFGMRVEVSGNGYSSFQFGHQIGYGSTEIAQPTYQSEIASLSAAFWPTTWDEFTWDDFIWDGTNLMAISADMTGEGENVSLAFRGSSDYYESFRLSGASIEYTPRIYLRS